MSDIIGIIGGSGLTRLDALEISRRELVSTPFGAPSAPMQFGHLEGLPVAFLPRHGPSHQVPPHRVNYRANIWAFRAVGVEQVIGMAAVGGISEAMAPGTLCVADQVIDYTYDRKHTYYEQDLTDVIHVDFTEPYCEALRRRLLAAAAAVDVEVLGQGTYGATQGPRLESAAEIRRLARDGCDMVGMTGMPEAALARELELCYANFSLVVNWAAGLGEGPITMSEIERHLEEGMGRAIRVIAGLADR